MKKARDVDDLAGRLAEAASTPLIPAPVATERPPKPKAKKVGSVSVFLRLPSDLHSRLENEAIARTKQTGKGVTVQQVIVDRLARAE